MTDRGDVDSRVLVDELTVVVGGARHEARFIVEEVLGVAGGRRPVVVPDDEATAARAMARRRAAGEPLQYILGHWPFRTLDLRVDARVLIPRPETELVVEVALGEARRQLGFQARAGVDRGSGRGPGLVAVDAGTGSGAIALALATELGAAGEHQIWATDLSEDALGVAAINLQACVAAAGSGPGAAGLPEVVLAHGSWLAPLPESLRGRVDLVVSNPPYVAEDEWHDLDPEVRAEPRQALVAGPGREGAPGLADVEAVLQEARVWLRRPGAVVIELAPRQAEPAQEWARQLGYDEGRVEPDLAGRSRALVVHLNDPLEGGQ